MKSKIKKVTKNGKRYAIIYIRVSGDEQVKGTSLDDQEARCRRYCEEQGYEVLAVFREEGESAKSADRKEFLKAIEFCRKNKGMVDAFIVWKVDRFARNREDHVLIRKTLSEYGTLLRSVTEPIGDSPTEKLMETMLAGFAEFDNDIRAQRCAGGMQARLLQGIWPWKPPVGYACAQHKKHGEKKTKQDEPNREVFPIIQGVLKGIARGVYTQSDAVRELQKTRFKKLTGQKPTPQLVDRLLTKHLRYYAGWLPNPWHEGEHDRYIKGKHAPMIDDDEMYAIQYIKSGKKMRTVRERDNPDYPMRRTVRCSLCNEYVTGSASRGNGGTYPKYHCYTKGCPMYGRTLRKADVESAFMQLLERVTPTPAFLDYFNHVVLTHWHAKLDVLKKEAHDRGQTLSVLETRRKNIFEMRESGAYTQEMFEERMAEVVNGINVAKISLSEVKIDEYDIEADIAYFKQAVQDVAKQWLDLKPQFRARFQKLIFPEGIAYDRTTGFGTIKLGRIYTLNQQYSVPSSTLVDLSRIELETVQCECTGIPLTYRPVNATDYTIARIASTLR